MGFTIATRIWNFNWGGDFNEWLAVPGNFKAINDTIYVYKDKDFEKTVYITFDPVKVDEINEAVYPLMKSGSYTLNNFRTNSTEFSVTPKSITNSSDSKYEVTNEHYINIQRKN